MGEETGLQKKKKSIRASWNPSFMKPQYHPYIL